jgi:hypothetical protein
MFPLPKVPEPLAKWVSASSTLDNWHILSRDFKAIERKRAVVEVRVLVPDMPLNAVDIAPGLSKAAL